MDTRRVIKRLAQRVRTKPDELLVMAHRNDPFYIGSETHYANARWAAELYRKLKSDLPVHVRRLHYFALWRREHKKPDRSTYSNTEADWKFLRSSCQYARYLNLLDPKTFTDRRNPYVFSDERQNSSAAKKMLLSRIDAALDEYLQLFLRSIMPIHIEIWVEKSTAADLIYPVTREYLLRVITSQGEISLTAIYNFIERIRNIRKPVRIFYISDFDPAGLNMPVSASRKIEFLMRKENLHRKIDLKVKPLVLTRKQCIDFELPTVPIRKKHNSFKSLHGKGCTELHALEVARPGYIAQRVEEQLSRYLDPNEIRRTKNVAHKALKPLIEVTRHALSDSKDLVNLHSLLQKKISTAFLSSRQEETTTWLFDSSFDYLRQLQTYKIHKMR